MTRCAIARVRLPTSTTTSNLLVGSRAVHTQYGERSSRFMASSLLLSPALSSRRTASNSIVQEFGFFASVLADGWGESQKETMSGRGPDDGMALAAWTWYNKALQHPNTPDRCGPMYAEVTLGWNVFKQIFTEHWEGFKPFRPRHKPPYYDDLVDKLLRYRNPDQIGYIEYRCLHCGQGKHRVAMSCKSSLCLRCAKVYGDNWVAQVGKMLHDGVIYRHIVLTVPDVLRTPLYQHAEALLSPFMPCGGQCLDDFLSTVSGKALQGGSIVVVQTPGRHGQYNPHLPIIATSGGWDAQAQKWVHVGYLPYPMLHKKWPWYALEMCREVVQTDAMARLVQACYATYPNGFVAKVPKGEVPSRSQSLATYLAQYVVSPPLSLRRIDRYAGQSVTSHERSPKTERVERE